MKENLKTSETNKAVKDGCCLKKEKTPNEDCCPQNKGKAERVSAISIVMRYHPKQQKLLSRSLKSSASSTILTNQSRKVNHL